MGWILPMVQGGVGFFLNVHEGPCGISPKSQEPLQIWMLLSNEPGYYREGAFGIRLENLMLVQKFKDKNAEGNETGKDLLYFETVTKVPFDDDCIIRDMLSPQELEWLNDYQAMCS
jgi:Xaa-Pro aminopeptidase